MSFLQNMFGGHAEGGHALDSARYGQGLANQIGAFQEAQNLAMAQQMGTLSTQYNQAKQRRVQAGAQTPIKPFNPNEIEAYQIPLSQLVTLWRAKYGDEWVNGNDDHKYDFYSHACTRLTASGLFENVHGWCRLKEDV
jgi:hypothetical protein